MNGRLLLVHDKPPAAGGVRRHVEDLAAGLRARGLRVVTLRLARPGDPGAVGDDHVLPITFGRRDRAADAALLALVDRTAPSIIHIHLGFTALAAPTISGLAARAPLVATLHDVAPFCPTGTRLTRKGDAICDRREGPACFATFCAGRGGQRAFLAALAFAPLRRRTWETLLRTAILLAPSRYVANLATASGAQPERLIHLAHGTVWADEPPPLPPEGEIPQFIFVGRLDPLKDLGLVLDALALLAARPWRLAICGDGPAATALRRQAAALGLSGRIDFLGSVPRPELRGVLASSRLALFPSRIPESFGLAGIEALALARPVVGFPVGGAADWLRHGETGLVPTERSPAALAACLAELIDDRTRAERLGATGRQLAVAEHGAARMIARHAALYACVGDRGLAGSAA